MEPIRGRYGKVFKPSPLADRSDMNRELNEEWKMLNDQIWETVGCVAEKPQNELKKSAPMDLPDLSYIWRNSQSNNNNGEQSVIRDSRRIYISNIPFKCTNDDLIALCQNIGPVISAEVIYNERGSKGFGFVSFMSEWAARQAIRQLNGVILDGRKIEVHPATPKEKTKEELKKKEEEKLYRDNLLLTQSIQKLYLKNE